MQIAFMECMLNKCFHRDNKKNDIAFSVSLTTHSPYIVNYINLAIRKKIIDINDVDVFLVQDRSFESLKKVNDKLIDTRCLSDPIATIYEE